MSATPVSTTSQMLLFAPLPLIDTIAAYLSDLFVGTICARLEKRPDGRSRAYVMVLAVLPAYRGIGVGT